MTIPIPDWAIPMLIVAALVVGTIYGRLTAIRSLLIGVDNPDRTPHKLGERFYYIVPEAEYNRLQRSDAAAFQRYRNDPKTV